MWVDFCNVLELFVEVGEVVEIIFKGDGGNVQVFILQQV